MTQAFYTGISGLQSNQTAIDVVADNLANISTVGYRGYEAEFTSLLENSIYGTANQEDGVGVGTQINSIKMNLESGTNMLSDNSTDISIMGDGWFGVIGNSETMYTRSGDFTFDANSDLVNASGEYVLGTMGGNIDADGNLTEVLDEIVLGDVESQTKLSFPKLLIYPTEPTTISEFTGNLGQEDAIRIMSSAVIDTQNNRNSLKLSFTKDTSYEGLGTKWITTATVQNKDGTLEYDTQTGATIFDERGAFSSTELDTIDNNGSLVKIDFGTGFDGLVSMGNSPISASSKSDGTIAGEIQGYDINQNGEVIATFSNGFQSSVGKIAIYHFINDNGLERASGSKFFESSNSGEPIFYKDEAGANITGANIANYSLESSNVDMNVGLTDLIILQRSYDANSKSITTADEMMQKALSMDA